MESIIPYLPFIVLAALCILVVARQIALGKGQQLADTALAFLLAEAQATLDKVTREDVNVAVCFVYQWAPAAIGPIPWKAFVSLQAVQALAWEAWERAHKFADSAGGIAAYKAVKQDRVIRAAVR